MTRIPLHPNALRILSILLTAWIVLFTTVSGGDDAKPFSGRLVFFGQSKQGEQSPATQIVSILPSGDDRRVEFTFDRAINGGSIAPNGQTLAFNSSNPKPSPGMPPDRELWIKELGKEPRQLACDGELCGWHPSGEDLLVFRLGKERHENLSVDVVTGDSTPLDLPGVSVAQTWMPSGNRVVAIAMNPGRRYNDPKRGSYPLRQLYLWDCQTAEQTVFTSAEHDCIWPAPSPDGSSIAFYLRRHTDRPHEFLAIAKSNGENLREVTGDLIERTDSTSIRVLGFPRWSSDGSEVAWLRTIKQQATNATTFELLFISIKDSSTRRLTLDDNLTWGRFDWGR